jgi:hypothetical protein
MSSPKRAVNRADLVDYTEYMISDALNSRVVDPQLVLECFFFALQPDLVHMMREFSGLDPEGRKKIRNEIRKTKGGPLLGRPRADFK